MAFSRHAPPSALEEWPFDVRSGIKYWSKYSAKRGDVVMAVKIDLIGNTIINCGGVLQAPSDMDLEFTASGNSMSQVGTIFHFTDPQKAESLGLEPGANMQDVDQVLEKLAGAVHASVMEQQEIVSESKLVGFLKGGVTIAELTSRLIDIVKNVT